MQWHTSAPRPNCSSSIVHLTHTLAEGHAGVFLNMQYLTPERVTLSYEMPLAEVVTDFFDELKSRSKGYASMEYQFLEYRVEDLVKMELKINGEIAEPLGVICHRCDALPDLHLRRFADLHLCVSMGERQPETRAPGCAPPPCHRTPMFARAAMMVPLLQGESLPGG